MTTRTSTPHRASAFGSAPTTSPRPPVFTNGAHSEATKRTFSRRLRSRREDAVVQLGEDIVPPLQVPELGFVHGAALERVVEPIELDDALVEPPRRIRDRRPGLHDE